MTIRCLLYLDANGLFAFRESHGALAPLGNYPHTESGLATFRAMVARQPKRAVYSLLADLVDEVYHPDAVPHVVGPDRRAMLERKRTQHLQGSPYSCALTQGRETRGRRDERVLFCGLTRNAVVDPWVNALVEQEARLGGIYTPALLTEKMPLQSSGDEVDAELLVFFTTAGVRQVFRERNRLRFSRLSPANESSLIGHAAISADEILRTHAYLVSQRLIARNATLRVRVIANRSDIPIIERNLRGASQLDYAHVDLEQLAKRSGMQPPVCEESDSTPLFLHWMAKSPGKDQLAPKAARRFYHVGSARQAMVAVGVAVFAACALLATKQQVDAWTLRQESARLSAQGRTDALRYAALIRSLPAPPASPEAVDGLMRQLAQARQWPITPEGALRQLSVALDREPAVRLDTFAWRYLPVEDLSSLPAWAQPAVGKNAASLSRIGLGFEPGAGKDRRAMVGITEAFVAAFAGDPAATARVVRMPVDLSSDATFSLAQGAGQHANPPTFAIELARKVDGHD